MAAVANSNMGTTGTFKNNAQFSDEQTSFLRRCGGGTGLCYSVVLMVCAIIGIVTATMGLHGTLSLKTVSIYSMVTGFFGMIGATAQFIVSILGLTGTATMQVVAGVTIAFSALTLLVASCYACASCFFCNWDRFSPPSP